VFLVILPVVFIFRKEIFNNFRKNNGTNKMFISQKYNHDENDSDGDELDKQNKKLQKKQSIHFLKNEKRFQPSRSFSEQVLFFEPLLETKKILTHKTEQNAKQFKNNGDIEDFFNEKLKILQKTSASQSFFYLKSNKNKIVNSKDYFEEDSSNENLFKTKIKISANLKTETSTKSFVEKQQQSFVLDVEKRLLSTDEKNLNYIKSTTLVTLTIIKLSTKAIKIQSML